MGAACQLNVQLPIGNDEELRNGFDAHSNSVCGIRRDLAQRGNLRPIATVHYGDLEDLHIDRLHGRCRQLQIAPERKLLLQRGVHQLALCRSICITRHVNRQSEAILQCEVLLVRLEQHSRRDSRFSNSRDM